MSEQTTTPPAYRRLEKRLVNLRGPWGLAGLLVEVWWGRSLPWPFLERVKDRVDGDVEANLGGLRAIDEVLDTSLARTYEGTVRNVYGRLWGSFLRETDRLYSLYWWLSAGTVWGLWGLSFYFAVAGVFFPGNLPLRAFLAFLSGQLIALFVRFVGASVITLLFHWRAKRVPEYFVFLRIMEALRLLGGPDALDSKENRRLLLRTLNLAAERLSDLSERASWASREMRFESERRFRAMSEELRGLEKEIVFPRPDGLESLRRTLLKYLRWAIEGHYGMMPPASLPPLGEATRGEIRHFWIWLRSLVGACVLGLPFAFLAAWLTDWETDIDVILSAGSAGEWMGLVIYLAVAANVARTLNPGVVGDIAVWGEFLTHRK